MKTRKYAAIYFYAEWNCSENSIIVSDGITIGNFQGSHIKKLYETICENYKVDEGEPYSCNVYSLFYPKMNEDLYIDFGSSYSVIDRFSNILVMISKQPILMCRLIWSDDNFETISGTERIYHYSEEMSALFWDDEVSISGNEIENIILIWSKINSIYRSHPDNGRIINILNYYYTAWRSHTIEQLIINIAIVLELLFAPHSQAEITHQIAFNVSKYMGTDADKRNSIYDEIRKFYSIRSAIIHGGMPNFNKIESVARNIFILITNIIVSIISNDEIAEIFADNNKRTMLLKSYLFK